MLPDFDHSCEQSWDHTPEDCPWRAAVPLLPHSVARLRPWEKTILIFVERVLLRLSRLQLVLLKICYSALVRIEHILFPQLPPPEEHSDAAREFYDWTPTSEPIFALIPPDYLIEGPGLIRKIQRK